MLYFPNSITGFVLEPEETTPTRVCDWLRAKLDIIDKMKFLTLLNPRGSLADISTANKISEVSPFPPFDTVAKRKENNKF